MTTYLVSYDLRKPGRDYTKLHEALRSYSKWCHPLESLWVLVTERTATEIRDHLVQFMDSNDGILVVRSGGSGAWRNVATKASEWLKENL